MFVEMVAIEHSVAHAGHEALVLVLPVGRVTSDGDAVWPRVRTGFGGGELELEGLNLLLQLDVGVADLIKLLDGGEDLLVLCVRALGSC